MHRKQSPVFFIRGATKVVDQKGGKDNEKTV